MLYWQWSQLINYFLLGTFARKHEFQQKIWDSSRHNNIQWIIDIMAWKNLKQRSLADSMLMDHEALRELDGVHVLNDTWKSYQN